MVVQTEAFAVTDIRPLFTAVEHMAQADRRTANGGIVPAGIINQRLQKEIHLLKINLRDEYQHPKYDQPKLLAPIDFDFRDKRILLVDDRIKTGSTIKLAKELMQEARMIKTFAVNGNADYALFDETCFKFPWIV